MVYLLTAWLTLYAGLSQADANIVLKAIQLILTTTLKLVNQALRYAGFPVEKASSLLVPLPIDIRTVYSRNEMDTDLNRIFLCPTCFSQYKLDAQVEVCSFKHSPRARNACNTKLWTYRLVQGQLKRIPKCIYTTTSLRSWLKGMLQRPTIDQSLRDSFEKAQNFHPTPGATMRDISESPFWESIRGYRQSEYHLVFASYIDWFNPLGNKAAGKSKSCGALVLYCLNLPWEIRFLQENVFIVCLIPLPHEADVWSLGHLLPHYVNSLLEFDIPGQRLPTYSSPKGVMVAARVYPNIADLLASKKYIGFGSLKSFYFCTFCTLHRDNLDNLDYQSWTPRSGVMVRQQALNWKNATTLAKKEELHKTNGVQYSPTLELPYFDPIAHTVIGVMHNRLEGDLQHHLRVFWGIGRPDKRTKTGAEEMAEMQEKDLDLEASQAASASTSIENQEDREKTTTGMNAPIGSLASLVIQVQDWNLIDMNMEDDLDYIPKSSEVFDFTKEQMQQIRSGLCNIGLSTSVARPPVNLGEKEHGKLKAQEELTLFSGMFPLILPEIWSRRKENEEADNTLHLACFCHLVAATNISMAYQTSDTAADKYMEHYVQYRNIAQSLYACWDPVPNHHFGMHIGSLLKFWGPLAALSEFPGERLNGSLANIQTNNHYSEMELTMIRQFELLQILGSHLETYDNLDHSAAMTSAEVAEFFLHKKELAIIHYNALLNYLHASGRDYHAADVDYYRNNLNLLILPRRIHFAKQIRVNRFKYSIQSKKEENSHIQFYMPGGQGTIQTGCIQQIWQLPLEYKMQTFLLIKEHLPLNVFDQIKNPYAQEPCSFLQSNLVQERLADYTLIIEPAHLICPLITYKRSAGLYGIDCNMLAINWSLNRGRY
ncbi:hypothetical protein F5890DRAFT_1421407 [Lentinula detonsa]|uniref:Transposase domain-containing protein n=1 Tax=Lentinula detonsa TaxID=2804962 RepID=A0AA38UPS4_9AGAR|nr:hypothetical protein F5890DRAFT_1421407 [Lentinula detonsa]